MEANPEPVITRSEPLPPPLPPPPPLISAVPPAIPPAAGVRKPITLLLNVCLALFVADGVVSLVDDSLTLISGLHSFGGLSGLVSLPTLLVSILVYCLMALTPLIPKRFFLPVTLFTPLSILAGIPFMIFFYSHVEQMSWVISLCQVMLGVGIVWWLKRGPSFRWPLIGSTQLGARGFTWANLLVFILWNGFVLLPALAVYLFFCSSMAVGHFSDGFLALRPRGLSVQARTYVRGDGKTVELVPMSHIAERDFYQRLSQSFSSNSTILMEGVSDERNLLTNKITYRRMAKSLGVAEQQKEFKPMQGHWVRADVDVEQFGTNTIDFLNLVMRIHSQGLKLETVLPVLQYKPAPDFQQQLWNDLLHKRNQRVLSELETRLANAESTDIIIPWGAAHMPEIAREVQKKGFRLRETREYQVIRFGNRR